MSWLDALARLNEIVKKVHLLEERHDQYTGQFAKLNDEVSKLRESLSELSSRVAVLEEGRKTTAAEVKLAVTEALATWEMRKLREENEDLKRKQLSLGDE